MHSSLLDMKESSDQNKESHDQRDYHVLGDINAVYSEISLNIICKSITYFIAEDIRVMYTKCS